MYNPHLERTTRNIKRAKILLSRIHHRSAIVYAYAMRKAENILFEDEAFSFSEECRQLALHYYNMVERLEAYIERQVGRLDRELDIDYYLWSSMRLAQADGRFEVDSIYDTIDAIVTIGKTAENYF